MPLAQLRNRGTNQFFFARNKCWRTFAETNAMAAGMGRVGGHLADSGGCPRPLHESQPLGEKKC